MSSYILEQDTDYLGRRINVKYVHCLFEFFIN